MLLLKLECSNFFLFKDLSLDFTYPRKLNSEIAENDEIFPGSKIKVRKHIVIMGANASGKTTLGYLLCLIYNYLVARTDGPADDLRRSINHADLPASFTVEFSIQKTSYRLSATFDKDGLIKETLTQVPILTTHNITELRHSLDIAAPDEYIRDEGKNEIAPGFSSYLLRLKRNKDILRRFRQDIEFWFALSAFDDDPIGQSGLPHIDISLISKLLPLLDNSVEDVVSLIPQRPPIIPAEKNAVGENPGTSYGNADKTYAIYFKNGQSAIVPKGDISKINRERLSQGTVEAISFSSVLSFLRKSDHATVFVDECLSHMHSELEKYIIWLSFLMKKPDSQLFFTTHNTEVCDLRLPTNSFLFLRREKDGTNTALWANSRLIKNDRNFRSYYENDYFDVLPDYSDLASIFADADGDGT